MLVIVAVVSSNIAVAVVAVGGGVTHEPLSFVVNIAVVSSNVAIVVVVNSDIAVAVVVGGGVAHEPLLVVLAVFAVVIVGCWLLLIAIFCWWCYA